MIDKKYFIAPGVLAGICVVSALLVSGVHYLAEAYGPKEDPNQVPDEVAALYEGDSSTSLATNADFTDYSAIAGGNKVTVTDEYVVTRGGEKVGYAYLVDCGKPVNTSVLLAVSFEGEISEDTLETVQPAKLNVYAAGDTPYSKTAFAYGDLIADGTVDIDTTDEMSAGATRSSSCIRSGCLAARDQYLASWTNAGPIVDEREQNSVAIFSAYFGEDKVASTEESTDFEPITVTYTAAEASGTVSKRYKVTMADGTVGYTYEGSGSANLGEGGTGTIDIFFGWYGDVEEGNTSLIRPIGYQIVSSTMSYSQWEDVYLAGVLSGDTSLDDIEAISCGATRTAGFIRMMMRRERDDYYALKIAEQAANVETNFETLYSDYESYEAVSDFTALSFSSSDGSGSVTQLYKITRTAGTSYVYYANGSISFEDDEGYTQNCSFAFYVGWTDATKPDAYLTDEDGFTYNDWKTGYFDQVVGDAGMDASVTCGATHSATIIQSMLTVEQTDVSARIAA